MPELLPEWLSTNYLELLGAFSGLAYIVFSIRQSILTWATGLATSALYIFVFFNAKFYADMGLQFYYVFISIYGWLIWTKREQDNTNSVLRVSRVKSNALLPGALLTLVIFALIFYILRNHTDSPVPVMDAMTTALSITATFMLARKIIEHWLIWIVVDLVSAGLYVYKGLWPTAMLFLVYTIMAYIGYRAWQKDIKADSR
jgi:nicotinamide mononucleotide transporter